MQQGVCSNTVPSKCLPICFHLNLVVSIGGSHIHVTHTTQTPTSSSATVTHEQNTHKGIMFMGMGVSGGEEGARNGPSLMPGGDKKAFDLMEPILTK
jgi:3-hydroxyisobutyrate dehydrogenase-like beta-hydroxyacid dehydrogenase